MRYDEGERVLYDLELSGPCFYSLGRYIALKLRVVLITFEEELLANP